MKTPQTFLDALSSIKIVDTFNPYRDIRGGSGNLNRWDRWIFRATAA